MVVFVLLKFLLLSHEVCKAHVVQCRIRDPHPTLQHYHQSGDLFIGGIASLSFNMNPIEFKEDFRPALFEDPIVVPKNYQHILALAFAVKEINETPRILSNFSLGFRIYDSYFNARWTYDATMRLTSSQDGFVPNYKCDTQSNLIAVVGGLDSDVSLHVATILGTYKVPQITYGFAPVIKDKSPGYSIYQMAPSKTLQYDGIIALLLYFKWTWVGILAMDDNNEEKVVPTLSSMFPQHGICIALIERSPRSNFATGISDMMHEGEKIYDRIMGSKANVFVVFGQSYSVNDLRWLSYMSEGRRESKGKLWILSSQMELVSMIYQRTWDADIIHGTLSFAVQADHLPKFQDFIKNRNPYETKADGFIRDFWQHAFNCVFQDQVLDELKGDICTGKEKLESVSGLLFETTMTSHSYGIYSAVYAAAHAVHAMHALQNKHRTLTNRMELSLLAWDQWRVRLEEEVTRSCNLQRQQFLGTLPMLLFSSSLLFLWLVFQSAVSVSSHGF